MMFECMTFIIPTSAFLTIHVFGVDVALTSDLSTSNSNQFIFSPNCNLVKFPQAVCKISYLQLLLYDYGHRHMDSRKQNVFGS